MDYQSNLLWKIIELEKKPKESVFSLNPSFNPHCGYYSKNDSAKSSSEPSKIDEIESKVFWFNISTL